jgi:hypothetical protein
MPMGTSKKAISREIAHLIRDKGYARNRAVAAAYDQARRAGAKLPKKR